MFINTHTRFVTKMQVTPTEGQITANVEHALSLQTDLWRMTGKRRITNILAGALEEEQFLIKWLRYVTDREDDSGSQRDWQHDDEVVVSRALHTLFSMVFRRPTVLTLYIYTLRHTCNVRHVLFFLTQCRIARYQEKRGGMRALPLSWFLRLSILGRYKILVVKIFCKTFRLFCTSVETSTKVFDQQVGIKCSFSDIKNTRFRMSPRSIAIIPNLSQSMLPAWFQSELVPVVLHNSKITQFLYCHPLQWSWLTGQQLVHVGMIACWSG